MRACVSPIACRHNVGELLPASVHLRPLGRLQRQWIRPRTWKMGSRRIYPHKTGYELCTQFFLVLVVIIVRYMVVFSAVFSEVEQQSMPNAHQSNYLTQPSLIYCRRFSTLLLKTDQPPFAQPGISSTACPLALLQKRSGSGPIIFLTQ